jgi:hypothetical protein
MTVEQFRPMHAARPFRPFEIHLANSRRLAVNHPEILSQSQSGRTIAVARPDDTIEIVDLLWSLASSRWRTDRVVAAADHESSCELAGGDRSWHRRWAE